MDVLVCVRTLGRRAMATSRKVSGVIRAALALLFCVAALGVLFEMADYYRWGDLQVRAPIFLLVPWAYTLKPKHKLITALAGISFICVVGAFLTLALPSWPVKLPPHLLNGLGAVGFIALAFALVVHAWSAILSWRSDRARLRAKSRGALERLTGGF